MRKMEQCLLWLDLLGVQVYSSLNHLGRKPLLNSSIGVAIRRSQFLAFRILIFFQKHECILASDAVMAIISIVTSDNIFATTCDGPEQ